MKLKCDCGGFLVQMIEDFDTEHPKPVFICFSCGKRIEVIVENEK